MAHFGVFYKCYKETSAVEYSLKQLFSIYPDCPVYLVSDGGNDFSYLEDKYPTLKCSLENDSRGWTLTSSGCDPIVHQYRTPSIHEKFYETFCTILQRIKDGVDFCSKRHILFMEPDVLVRGELTIPLESHLLGVIPQPNISYDAGWNKVLKGIGGSYNTIGWSWPIIFSSEAFLKAYSFAKENETTVRDLLLSDVRFGIADDVWLPVLFGACGYKQENNPEVAECNRNLDWKTSGHPLLHEYRAMYPNAGDPDIGRHSAEEHNSQ